ncbi:MAG: hypothetical protein ACFFDW_03045 [Candidatus Thorarchaeota archaeon]
MKVKFSLGSKLFFTVILVLIVLNFSYLKLESGSQVESNQSDVKNCSYNPSEYIINAPSVFISRVYEINDDSVGSSWGDNDNLVDAGEIIELRMELENDGDELASNVYGNITTTNPFVTLINYNQSFFPNKSW